MEAQKLVEKFIYSCSHDLRAPLASIQGLVRIAEYYPHHEETHKCLEMIESCTDTLDKLIRRLEEFMINDDYKSIRERTTAEGLIKLLEPEFKNQLESADIQLSWNIDDEAMKNIDAFALVRILRYLISNSIAYHDATKSNRLIQVKISSTQSGSHMEVSDNGSGIRKDQLDRLFEIFRRGSETSIGLGMGLFLMKGLADKMGATVQCLSELNLGTTFIFEIPAGTGILPNQLRELASSQTDSEKEGNQKLMSLTELNSGKAA